MAAKSDFSMREALGFAFSCVAFVLSIIAFIAGLRRANDVSVSITGVISGYNYEKSTVDFTIASDLAAAFINNGTQPVAIQQMFLLVSQKDVLSDNDVSDCYESATVLVYQFTPFVVKSKDVVVQPLTKIVSNNPSGKSGSDKITVWFDNPKVDIHPLLLCLSITYVFPDHAPRVEIIRLLSERWPLNEPVTPSEVKGYLYYDKPPRVMMQEIRYSLF